MDVYKCYFKFFNYYFLCGFCLVDVFEVEFFFGIYVLVGEDCYFVCIFNCGFVFVGVVEICREYKWNVLVIVSYYFFNDFLRGDDVRFMFF